MHVVEELDNSTHGRPRHPPATYAELLAAATRDHAAAVAIAAPGLADLTYGELGRRLEGAAAALAAGGYARGTRIGVALPDGPRFALAMLAVASVATCAPLNDRLDEGSLRRLLLAMRVDALIVPNHEDSAASRAGRAAGVALITLRDGAAGPLGELEFVFESVRAPAAPEPPHGTDIAFLMHTSGTTGTPKVVPWEQWRVAEVARNRVELARLDRTDRCLIGLPVYSSAGIRRTLAGLLCGGSIVCAGAASADETIGLLQRMAPTHYFAPPALHMALIDAFGRCEPPPRHCLKAIWSGTTGLPAAVRDRLEALFSVVVLEGYGMTESGSIAETPFPPDRAPAGSVGRTTNIDIAIADEAGTLLGPGETGEILVRGPEVFAGYESDEEANRAAFRDGWLRTGDAGYIDRDGFVFLAGRLNDIVSRGGTKIAPAEIEAALALHAQVIEAAAFGVPHPTLGQDLVAAVKLREAVNEGDLLSFLGARLAGFKLPTRIITLPDIPRGASGKVDRAALADLAVRARQTRFEAPVGPAECGIARVFCDVLRLSGVGRDDHFFDLGGDSLRAVRAIAGIGDALGVSVTLRDLFDHPTVARLAAALHGRGRAAPVGVRLRKGASVGMAAGRGDA